MPRKDGYSKEIAAEAELAIAPLRDMLKDLDARIAGILQTLKKKDGDFVAGQARNAARVRRQVVEALKNLGARDVSTSMQDSLAAAAERIGERVAKDLKRDGDEAGGFTFDADASQDIARIANGYTKGIAAIFGDNGKLLLREINSALTGAGDVEKLIQRASYRVETSFSQSKTIVDTAVSAASRTAITETAGAVVDEGGQPVFVYRYVGPSDDLTRPFCDDHLGKYVSQEYIERTLNDQGLPMSSTCGGYNCRHSLAPIERSALPEGADIL